MMLLFRPRAPCTSGPSVKCWATGLEGVGRIPSGPAMLLPGCRPKCFHVFQMCLHFLKRVCFVVNVFHLSLIISHVSNTVCSFFICLAIVHTFPLVVCRFRHSFLSFSVGSTFFWTKRLAALTDIWKINAFSHPNQSVGYKVVSKPMSGHLQSIGRARWLLDDCFNTKVRTENLKRPR